MSALVPQCDKERVTETVTQLCHRAHIAFSRPFPVPVITYRKSGKNAGTAFLQQNRINFNPVLFAHNRQAFFEHVIPHEVSHLVVFQRFGKVRPHGFEWQYVMREVFHTAPRTTHNLDVSILNIKTHLYQCKCQQIELSVRRHKNVLRGQRYQCRRCNSILQAVE